MDTAIETDFTHRQKAAAWGVHLFTASGVVLGLLSLIAIVEKDWRLAFIWLAISIIIDGVDGFLARRAHVKEVLPNVDGALLDNIVDYFTYVIVPAFFLYYADLLPPNWEVIGGAVVMLTSAYQFTQWDAKTEDHYFKGFPSYWSVAVYYLVLMRLNPWSNLAIIIFWGVMVFVPFKYIYPSRTPYLQRLTLFLAVLWTPINLAIFYQWPDPDPWLLWASLSYVFYYVGLSLYSTWKAWRVNRQLGVA